MVKVSRRDKLVDVKGNAAPSSLDPPLHPLCLEYLHCARFQAADCGIAKYVKKLSYRRDSARQLP